MAQHYACGGRHGRLSQCDHARRYDNAPPFGATRSPRREAPRLPSSGRPSPKGDPQAHPRASKRAGAAIRATVPSPTRRWGVRTTFALRRALRTPRRPRMRSAQCRQRRGLGLRKRVPNHVPNSAILTRTQRTQRTPKPCKQANRTSSGQPLNPKVGGSIPPRPTSNAPESRGFRVSGRVPELKHVPATELLRAVLTFIVAASWRRPP
jgi:hypothetical protein